MVTVALLLSTLVAALGQASDEERFAATIASYLRAHRAAVQELQSSGGRATVTHESAATLAHRIAAQRVNAKPGDIFGPVAVRIRQTITAQLKGPNGVAILKVVYEPDVAARTTLNVNERYSDTLPRATMPGQLLLLLPSLPPELEYRFLGRSRWWIDSDAQLVADVLPDVLPIR